MNYSTINALFYSLPIAFAYLILIHYFRRRNVRLGLNGKTYTRVTTYETNREAFFLFVPIFLLRMLVALKIDDHWDDFRHTYEIPARSIDALLLVGFANVGLMAALLSILIVLIEIYDRLRANKQR